MKNQPERFKIENNILWVGFDLPEPVNGFNTFEIIKDDGCIVPEIVWDSYGYNGDKVTHFNNTPNCFNHETGCVHIKPVLNVRCKHCNDTGKVVEEQTWDMAESLMKKCPHCNVGSEKPTI